MADALASGASARKGVRVQVPPSAPSSKEDEPFKGSASFAFQIFWKAAFELQSSRKYEDR